jgi:hypothetical protein
MGFVSSCSSINSAYSAASECGEDMTII